MVTKKIIIESEEIWISAEECLSSIDGRFIGYISFFSTQIPGVLHGEAVKDDNQKYIIFENEKTALEEAEKYYIKNFLQSKI